MFAAFTAAFAGFLFGFDTVVISGAEQKIQTLWQLRPVMHGVAMASALYGTVLGSLCGGWPTDRWGRRPTLLGLGCLYLVSAIGAAFAQDVYQLIAARLIGGLGIGISTVVAPLYIAEIAPPAHRGRLAGMFQFNIVLGIVIAYASNALLAGVSAEDWRWMMGVAAIPSIAYGVMCLRIPESPRWLLGRRSDHAAAVKVLQYLNPRRSAADIEALTREIELATTPAATAGPFWSRRLRAPILTAVLVALFNQLSGINAILYFAPRIFALAGLNQHAALLQSVGIGITNLLFTFVGLALIDRFGRRTMLFGGCVGYVASLSLVSWAFFTAHFAIVPACVFVFIASHAVGQGTVIWVLIAEIFPNEHRAQGQALGSFTHWIAAAVITSLFPAVVAAFAPGYVFAFFGAMMALQWVWVKSMLIETKAVPLELVQERLDTMWFSGGSRRVNKRIGSVVSSLLAAVWVAGVQARAAASPPPWWQHAVIYEIYPRSFADSNGDGVGDLQGITQHLDYLQDLGIDAIWIAPMYPSPQVDFGYDISDYRDVDPLYGSLADFDRLQGEAQKRGMRVVLDMVLNHTSDKHQWFVESSSSRHNSKADWYVWNPGLPTRTPGVTAYQRRFEHEGRVPPNNWESLFGGSAWEWSVQRKQFYYHKFYKQQPDLNWRNPAVETAMFDVMRFWLDRGVAGFRLDAIPTLFEDPMLRNEPESGGVNAQGDPNLREIYTSNLAEVHGTIRRMREMMDRYPGDRVLIGETYLNDTAELDRWYGGVRHDELQLPMDMLVGFGAHARFDAGYFRRTIGEVETQVHGSQPLLVFDNHDNVRSIDRFGDGVHDLARAKVLAAILLMPRGAAMTYYGAPIGMSTHTPTNKADVKDPIGITGWPAEKGRDGERTPMQWTPGPQAGFSSNPRTWLPVAADHERVNVQSETADPHSLLNWYKQLIALRRSNDALRDGDLTMLDTANPDILSFVRVSPTTHAATVVALNLSSEPRTTTIDLGGRGIHGTALRALAATHESLLKTQSPGAVQLPPYGAWVAAVE